MAKSVIVLFEDDERYRKLINSALGKTFKNSGAIVHAFDPAPSQQRAKTYESEIKDYLSEKKLINLKLFITDKDLSRTKGGFTGLSEAAISAVSEELSIPICLYARGLKGNKLQKQQRWSDYKIILDAPGQSEPELKKVAANCRTIYEGFKVISEKYAKLDKKDKSSPASILAKILNKPHLKDRISLYGTGDTHMISDILPYFNMNNTRAIEKRIPRFLGYWLWDSIMRYPGILLNQIAVASYLNINPSDFDKVRDLFEKALYKGPFANAETPLWWRDELDEIIFKDKAESGLDLVRKTKPEIRECKCFVGKKEKAGFYCMVTRKPVCEKHSRSNISWFPAGADLARISESEFRKLAPWLGLY